MGGVVGVGAFGHKLVAVFRPMVSDGRWLGAWLPVVCGVVWCALALGVTSEYAWAEPVGVGLAVSALPGGASAAVGCGSVFGASSLSCWGGGCASGGGAGVHGAGH